MVELTDTEAALIDDLVDCIREAIERTDGIDKTYANKTKIQKLLYFAIDAYDLPVTYSWYLAGAVLPDTSISPSTLASPQGPDTPDQPHLESSQESSTEVSTDSSEIGSSDSVPNNSASVDHDILDPIMFTGSEPISSHGGLAEYVEREKVIGFYQEKLLDVWSQNTMRFLQNFYQATAPDRYRRLYIESTHLRTHLSTIADIIRTEADGAESSQSVTKLATQLAHTISDFHYELRQLDELQPSFRLVVKATDLIEKTVRELARRDPETYPPNAAALIDELQEFFYYYVWRYPCLEISAQTATGPSAYSLCRERRERWDAFDRELLVAYERLATSVAEAGLSPDPLAVGEEREQAVEEKLIDLSEKYFE